MDFLNTDEKKQRRLVHLPMGRFGEAVELANAALFCTCCFLFSFIVETRLVPTTTGPADLARNVCLGEHFTDALPILFSG